MKTADEIRKHLVEKADGDVSFRDDLVKDPRGTFEKEIGVEIPENVSIHVHQENDTDFHIVLPSEDKLSEQQLEEMYGGYGNTRMWSNNDHVMS